MSAMTKGRTPGEQIRDEIEARGWSRDRLATEAGVSSGNAISAIIKGKNCRLDILQRIATALGITIQIPPGLDPPWADRPGRKN